MKEILSSDNKQIKLLKKLKLKKYRQESALFLVENFVIIKDALNSGDDAQMIFLSSYFIEKNKEEVEFLKKHSQAEFFEITDKLNKEFSSLDTPSGVAAVYSKVERELSSSPKIYLDNINDPGNLGTIMRSAAAFGFENIILSADCVDIYNHKTISSAKNSIFKLNVLIDEEGTWLKKNISKEMKLYVSDVKDGQDVFEFKASLDFCLVLGSESHGVREEISKMADERLMIRMGGNMESLNVAVAAGIFFSVLSRS